MSRRLLTSRPTPSARGRDDDPVAIFVRGATLGAFVGAVVAGSTVWHRIRREISGRGAARPSGPGPASPPRDPVPPRRVDRDDAGR